MTSQKVKFLNEDIPFSVSFCQTGKLPNIILHDIITYIVVQYIMILGAMSPFESIVKAKLEGIKKLYADRLTVDLDKLSDMFKGKLPRMRR